MVVHLALFVMFCVFSAIMALFRQWDWAGFWFVMAFMMMGLRLMDDK
jgi:hypothetical protein